VSDYSEQEQWESVKAWLRANGLWILAGVLIGVGGLVGWNTWRDRQENHLTEAASRYELAIEAFGRNDRTRGVQLTEELAQDFADTPYADMGRMLAARAHVEAGELDKAATSLTAVMTSTKDQELRVLARLRLARVQSGQGKHDEAIATLGGGDAGKFAPRFDDARGDVLYAKGDTKGAIEAYQRARAAAEPGLLDVDLLDLKIRDLGAVPVEAPAAAAAPAAPMSAG
jgi:predicted negative regulator of RcsB-dependent stress response